MGVHLGLIKSQKSMENKIHAVTGYNERSGLHIGFSAQKNISCLHPFLIFQQPFLSLVSQVQRNSVPCSRQ